MKLQELGVEGISLGKNSPPTRSAALIVACVTGSSRTCRWRAFYVAMSGSLGYLPLPLPPWWRQGKAPGASAADSGAPMPTILSAAAPTVSQFQVKLEACLVIVCVGGPDGLFLTLRPSGPHPVLVIKIATIIMKLVSEIVCIFSIANWPTCTGGQQYF